MAKSEVKLTLKINFEVKEIANGWLFIDNDSPDMIQMDKPMLLNKGMMYFDSPVKLMEMQKRKSKKRLR